MIKRVSSLRTFQRCAPAPDLRPDWVTPDWDAAER
jgi:hypothetical protein